MEEKKNRNWWTIRNIHTHFLYTTRYNHVEQSSVRCVFRCSLVSTYANHLVCYCRGRNKSIEAQRRESHTHTYTQANEHSFSFADFWGTLTHQISLQFMIYTIGIPKSRLCLFDSLQQVQADILLLHAYYWIICRRSFR